MPESTLIMLVSALAGKENVLNAYKVAVEEKYRFFSFGDAMFIHWVANYSIYKTSKNLFVKLMTFYMKLKKFKIKKALK